MKQRLWVDCPHISHYFFGLALLISLPSKIYANNSQLQQQPQQEVTRIFPREMVEKIDSVQESVDKNSKEIKKIKNTVQDIEDDVDEVQQTADIIEDKVCTIESSLDDLSDISESILDKVTSTLSIVEKIDDTTESILDKTCLTVSIVDKIDDTTESTDSKVDVLQMSADSILDKACDTLSVVEIIDTRTEELVTTADTIQSKVCVIEDKLDVFTTSNFEQVVSLLDVIQSVSENILVTFSIIDILVDNLSDLEQLDLKIDSVFDKVCDTLSIVDKIDDTTESTDSKVDILQTTANSILDKVCDTLSIVDKIDDTTESTDSKVDVLQTTANSTLDKTCDILSIVDKIDDTSETILQKTCSILDQVDEDDFLEQGPAFTSLFGSGISEPVCDRLNGSFHYGISEIQFKKDFTLTGTVFTNQSMAIVASGTDANATASLQTARFLRYRSGHESYGLFTALFETSVANSTQWIGLFDVEDGFAVGFDGTTFSILHRIDGVDTIIPQSSFNIDPLDGTGPSGFTLDTTKLNIFRIGYGYLGASVITFRIMNETAQWITFHKIEYPNSNIKPNLSNPFLPMRAEVIKTSSDATDLKIKSGSWNAALIGMSPIITDSELFLTASGTLSSVGAMSEQHVVTIRNKSIFQGRTNKVEIRLAAIGGGSLSTGNQVVLLRLRKNATVTGISFSDVNAGNSVIEISDAGTFTANTGTLILTLPTFRDASGPELKFFPRSFEILLLPGETFTITAQSNAGNALDILGLFGWEERF